MPEASRYARALAWLLPQSLLGRLSVVMVAGVLMTQLAGNLIWGAQLRKDAEVEAKLAAQHIAHSAASAVRFFLSLPANYRPILIQQFREMGGTRFFVNVNRAPLAIQQIEARALSDTVVASVGATLKQDLPQLNHYRVAFAWPGELSVSDSGSKIADLPESWVQHILLVKPNPAPILVIQTELEPGNWLYLAALMPNPYFLDSGNPLALDRVLLQGLSLAAVLLLSILVVRWTTRPLAALSDAAEAFGKGENMPELPETGSREFVNTARAFSAMRERIQRYLEDRERLFVSISHDLRTPITRLKLRSELLDDDALRNEFHDDLDELDMMVKGALQCVKDSDIHENPTEVRLDALLKRMVRGSQLGGHQVQFSEAGLSVTAKPLALKRAIGNLLDNALYYGKRADISVHREPGHVAVRIRDYGPGVPEEAFGSLFQPYVRLAHGRDQNADGMGLGLGIARSIVQAHGGHLTLVNHPDGGLVATISLPAQ
ncbi:ATP-binding protein [Janthinobacterium fluminis]|uniref:histidine kinase n=1 Tax=Janthinobacterium fluminis TaxID=2987524 RepID=A0ABT5K1G2_9BURK|nr:ATP-binding protein [Janthinobacterium fluminis]MDC8758248.1 ATP-binding protein [Janthinobacterium fluminis]